jgi:hypothetical protein
MGHTKKLHISGCFKCSHVKKEGIEIVMNQYIFPVRCPHTQFSGQEPQRPKSQKMEKGDEDW